MSGRATTPCEYCGRHHAQWSECAATEPKPTTPTDLREALIDVIERALPPHFTDLSGLYSIADAILSSGLVVPKDDMTEALRILANPTAVHINMARGQIAKPSVEQILHLYAGLVVPAPQWMPVSEAPDDGSPGWLYIPGKGIEQRQADGSFWRWEVRQGNFKGWLWQQMLVPAAPALGEKSDER